MTTTLPKPFISDQLLILIDLSERKKKGPIVNFVQKNTDILHGFFNVHKMRDIREAAHYSQRAG